MYLVKAAIQKTSYQEDDTWVLPLEVLYQSWTNPWKLPAGIEREEEVEKILSKLKPK